MLPGVPLGGMELVGVRCAGDDPPCSLVGLAGFVDELVDILGLTHAWVDGLSDCRELPPVAVEALDRLRAIDTARHAAASESSRWKRWRLRRGPTAMGIELDLAVPSERAIFVGFGPYSIQVETVDAADAGPPLVLRDSGESVLVRASEDDRDAVEGLLARFGASHDEPT